MFLIHSTDRRKVPGCPESIPWEVVAPHEQQAIRNHCQSLEGLNQRGGLSLAELYYVLRDEDWPRSGHPVVANWMAMEYIGKRVRDAMEATP